MAKQKKRKPSKADRADIHALYQEAVQDPENELDTFDRFFKRYRKRKPRSLKEDFCGTALFATAWVERGKKRWAVGVDLDGPTLNWGREHNIGAAGSHVAKRIQLVEANVLDVQEPPVDLVCALNYSYCVFKTREALIRYFKIAKQSLNPDGIFICDIYGGTEATIEHTDPKAEVQGLQLRVAAGVLQPDHPRYGLPHQLLLLRWLVARAGLHLRVAALDAAGDPRVSRRGGLRPQRRVVGRWR